MAGNIRFHNKFHAYTHYTDPVPGIPGSAMDPIASEESPFLGNMYIAGCLSAHGWLDEDGTCRKFLFEEDIGCRPVKICGDHMEGALHYSHVVYNTTINYDPKRLEIDFQRDTFKTIVCDESEYHIMPTSLSAGCVTSVRFINPSANGDVNLAWHPHLTWLCKRPCILSAGEEAILSMTSFSNNLNNVLCIWKEREHELEQPYVKYSPTISLTTTYNKYAIDSCEPILYKFILQDETDIAKLELNYNTVLIANIGNELIWDDTSWDLLKQPITSLEGVPDITEMYIGFPERAGTRNLDQINRAKELLDKSNRLSLGDTKTFNYSGCDFLVQYAARGSILFNISVSGNSLLDETPLPIDTMESINVVGSSYSYINGIYHHDGKYTNSYVGDSNDKVTVVKNRVWSKLVQEFDPFYNPNEVRKYTIERHVSGSFGWWILKSPNGKWYYKNSARNYPGERNYPLQNKWDIVDQTLSSEISIYLQKQTPMLFDGFGFQPGEFAPIVDEYVRLDHTGDYYGECFVDWLGYDLQDDLNVYITPENTNDLDEPEKVLAFITPGHGVDVDGPAIAIDPGSYTQKTNSPIRYRPGDLIRVFTKLDETEMNIKYKNEYKGPKSKNWSEFQNGGTYKIRTKGPRSINGQMYALCLMLECV